MENLEGNYINIEESVKLFKEANAKKEDELREILFQINMIEQSKDVYMYDTITAYDWRKRILKFLEKEIEERYFKLKENFPGVDWNSIIFKKKEEN